MCRRLCIKHDYEQCDDKPAYGNKCKGEEGSWRQSPDANELPDDRPNKESHKCQTHGPESNKGLRRVAGYTANSMYQRFHCLTNEAIRARDWRASSACSFFVF